MTVKDVLMACDRKLLAKHAAQSDYFINIDNSIDENEKERRRKIIEKDVFEHLENIEKMEVKANQDKYIVATKVIDSFPEEPESYIDTFLVLKDELLNKDIFDLSNNYDKQYDPEKWVRAYGYEFKNQKEILECVVSPYSLKTIKFYDLVFSIYDELTFFGINEEFHDEKVESEITELKRRCDEIENGSAKTIPAEDVFKKLGITPMTDDEKKKLREITMADAEINNKEMSMQLNGLKLFLQKKENKHKRNNC